MFTRTYTPPVSVAQHSKTQPDEDRTEPRMDVDAGSLDLLLRAALEEDVGSGDVTTEALESDRRARGRLVARAPGVVYGLALFVRVFELLDDSVTARLLAHDGDTVERGATLLELEGGLPALLTGERTALNFVQRLSGIATLTRSYVERVGGRARVLDTRKTTPGLRALEKQAVRCGGGENHRFGLFDEVMIKNNHLDLAGCSMLELLTRLRARHGNGMRITAEARDEAEALEAVAGDADVVMLDNMPAADMRALCPRLRQAARNRSRPLELEASGGIDLDTVSRVADCGVDRISIGALTHSAPALDLALRLEVVA